MEAFSEKLRAKQIDSLALASAAGDRHTYIQRPDLGRILDDKSKRLLQEQAGTQSWDVVFVIADGLSALAVERHALPVIEMTRAHLTLKTGASRRTAWSARGGSRSVMRSAPCSRCS